MHSLEKMYSAWNASEKNTRAKMRERIQNRSVAGAILVEDVLSILSFQSDAPHAEFKGWYMRDKDVSPLDTQERQTTEPGVCSTFEANQDQGQTIATLLAVIDFTLNGEETLAWLRLWNEGSFDSCRKEWPEAPEQCYPVQPRAQSVRNSK